MAVPVFQYSLDVSPERRDWEMVAGDTAYLTLTFRRQQSDTDPLAIDPNLVVTYQATPTEPWGSHDYGASHSFAWGMGDWTHVVEQQAPASGTATSITLPIVTDPAAMVDWAGSGRMRYVIRTKLAGMVTTVGYGLWVIRGAMP